MLAPTVCRSDAYRAASEGSNPEAVTKVCDFWRRERAAPIDQRCNTILHLLARHGNTCALKNLLEHGLLTSAELRQRNRSGDTALHEAANFGHENFVKIMLQKDGDLVWARNNLGETPLYIAAKCGKDDVFNFLKAKVQSDSVVMSRNDGSTVLHAAVMEEYYSLAMSILESFPHLAYNHDENGMTALNLLAAKPSSFRSGSSYWPENLGSWPSIPIQIVGILLYLCITSTADESKHDDVEDPHQNRLPVPKSKGHLRTKLIAVCAWLRGIEEAKSKHTSALELAKGLVRKEKDWSYYTYCKLVDSSTSCPSQKKRNRMKNPLMQATQNGISEMVMDILGEFPYAAYATDENGKNVLHIAVEQKDRILYEYFMKNFDKKNLLADVDIKRNTVLHLATLLGTSPRVLLGRLNQMTWDVCWFKRVLYDSPPHLLNLQNSEGKTAKELFKKNHSDLQDKSEEALKDMNNGLMLVSALIGTVNYAALFTPPGGFDQGDGSPLLFKDGKREDLVLFFWYTGFALFFSLFSILTMLSIQLSRFRTSDFYMALPFRFLVAMTSLFSSAIFTILSCFIAYHINEIKIIRPLFWGPACFVMALVYLDTVFLTVRYMHFAICYSLLYKGQEILDLLI